MRAVLFLLALFFAVTVSAQADCSDDFVCEIDDVVVECSGNEYTFPTTARATGDYTSMLWESTDNSASFTPNNAAALTVANAVFPSTECSSYYTLTATFDVSGESLTCTGFATISDTLQPQWIDHPPANVSVACDDLPLAPVLRAVDICRGALTVSYSEEPHSDHVKRTWSADDGCTAAITHVQYITITDNTPPVLIGDFDNYNVECDAVPEPCDASAYDNCDANVNIVYNTWDVPGECDQEKLTYRSWTVTDSNNNSHTEYQIITVNDTTVPEFVYGGTQDIVLGCRDSDPIYADSLAPEASDNCDPHPTIVPSSQVADADPCNYKTTHTWTATDACGKSASFDINVTTTDQEKPQANMIPEDISIECGDSYSFCNLSWTDDCDTSLTTSAIAGSPVIVGTNGCQDMTITMNFTASDDCGKSGEHTQTVTISDNTPPEFDALPPAAITVGCEHVPEYEVTATDSCDGVVNVTMTNTTIYANSDPLSNNYEITRTWNTVDACGNPASYIQIVTVTDSTPPFLLGSFAPTVNLECNTSLPASTMTAADNCDCDAMSVNVSDVTTGTICKYTTIRNWMVTDCDGLTASSGPQMIYVEDTTPPFYVCPSSDSREANGTAFNASSYRPSHYENDTCTSASVSGHFNNFTDDGCKWNFTYNFYTTVQDECDLGGDCAFTVQYRDTQPPSFSNASDSTEVNCSDWNGWTHPSLHGTDAAFESSELIITDGVPTNSSGATDCDFTTSATYTITDPCGHEGTSITQVVRVRDSEAPEFVIAQQNNTNTEWCSEHVSTIMSGSLSFWGPVGASDDCVGYNLTDTVTASGSVCPSTETYTNTHTLTDDCGKTAPNYYQYLTFQDTTEPEFFPALPSTVFTACNSSFDVNSIPLSPPAYDKDPCTQTLGAAVTVTRELNEITDSQLLAMYGQCELWNATYTATDCANNTNVTTVLYGWSDSVAPYSSSSPSGTTYECYDDMVRPTYDDFSPADNCGAQNLVEVPMVEYNVTDINGNITGVDFFFAWTDECGNTYNHTISHTFSDTTPPVITPIADYNLTCDDTLTQPIFNVSDNCDVKFKQPGGSTFPICGANALYVYTMKAYDTSGLSDQESVNVYVVDNQGYTWNSWDPWGTGVGVLEHSITCNDTATPTPPTYTIACPSDNFVTNGSSVTNVTDSSNAQNYNETYTYSAVDNCTINHGDKVAKLFVTDPYPVNMPDQSDVTVSPGQFCFNNHIGLADWTYDQPVCGSATQGPTNVTWDNCTFDGTHYTYIRHSQGSVCKDDAPTECDYEHASETYQLPNMDDAVIDPTISLGSPVSSDASAGWYSYEANCSGTADCILAVMRTEEQAYHLQNSLSLATKHSCYDNFTCLITQSDAFDCQYTVNISCEFEHPCSGSKNFTFGWVITDQYQPTSPTCESNATECVGGFSPSSPWTLEDPGCNSYTGNWTQDCSNSYTNAQFECKRYNNDTADWSIEDTSPPTVHYNTYPVQECNATAITAAVHNFTDDCSNFAMLFQSISTSGPSLNTIVGTNWFEHTFTVTVTDECDHTDTDTVVIVYNDTIAPDLTVPSNETIEAVHDTDYQAYADNFFQTPTLSAYDACGPANLTYPYVVTPNGCPYNYTITYDVEAEDGIGHTTSATVEYIIQDTLPPVLNNKPPALETNCYIGMNDTSLMAALDSWAVTATDQASGDLTANITKLSGYTEFHDNPLDDNFTYTVNWTVEDDCGHTDFYEASLVCVDLAVNRTLVCPNAITKPCTDEDDYNVDCIADPQACFESTILNWSLTGEGDYITITESTHVQENCSGVDEWHTINVTLFTEDAEYVESCDFEITYYDIDQPIVHNTPPPTVTYECTYENYTLNVTDNCASELTEYSEQSSVFLDVPSKFDYSVDRTWVINDDCGNGQVTIPQTVSVRDTKDPYFIAPFPPSHGSDNCSFPEIPTMYAEDNCTTVTITNTTSPIVTYCDSNATRRVSYTATDEQGNYANYDIFQIAVDITPPVLAVGTNLTNKTYELKDSNGCAVPQTTITGYDECDGAVTGTEISGYTDPIDLEAVIKPYTWTRKWSLCDACGNCIYPEEHVTLVDNTDPEITIITNNQTVECSTYPRRAKNTYNWIGYTISDECHTCDETTSTCFVNATMDVTEDCIVSGEFLQLTTFTVYDQNGNTGTSTVHKYEVKDTKYPAWENEASSSTPWGVSVATDIFGCYEQNLTESPPRAADTCDFNSTLVTVTSQSVTDMYDSDGDTNCELYGTITYEAADGCGNVNPENKTYTAWGNDTDAPVVTATSRNVSTSCNFDLVGLPDDETYFWGESHSSSGVAWSMDYGDNIENSDICHVVNYTKTCTHDIDEDCLQKITCTFSSITDECGNTAPDVVVTQTWEDVTAPHWANFPTYSDIECNATDPVPVWTLPAAYDNCAADGSGVEGNYSLAGMVNVDVPVTYVAEEGANYQVGYYYATYTATDHCGNNVTNNATAIVRDTTPPYFSTDMDGESWSDNCTGTPPTPATGLDDCAAATDNVTSNCGGLSSNCTVCTFYHVATDDVGRTAYQSWTYSTIDTTPPVIDTTGIDATNVFPENCTVPTRTLPPASDNCAYEQNVVDTGAGCSYVTDSLYGTTRYQKCVYNFTATDNCGNVAYYEAEDHAYDTTPPVITTTATNKSLPCNESLPVGYFDIDVTDNCDNVTAIPTSETTNDTCWDRRSIKYTWTSTDLSGNTDSVDIFVWYHDDVKPTLTNAAVDFADENITCSDNYTVPTPYFSDDCTNPTDVNYTVSSTPGESGSFFNCTDYSIDFHDDCGNEDFHDWTICVVDVECPVFQGLPTDDDSYECDAIPTSMPSGVTYTDDCYAMPLVPVDAETVGSCTAVKTLTRTWTVNDGQCVKSHTHTRKIVDTTPPTFDIDDSYDMECNETLIPLTASNLFDNCDLDITNADRMSEVESTAKETNTTYRVTYTFTLTDECGNTATENGYVQVNDTIPPEHSDYPANMTVSCDQVPLAYDGMITATDNCDDDVDVIYAETVTPGGCDCNYTLTRTWDSADMDGNPTTHTQIIEVRDLDPPSLHGIPADVTVESDNVPEPPVLNSATGVYGLDYGMDGFADYVTVMYSQSSTCDGNIATCPSEYNITRTWTTCDACNLCTDDTQLIIVVDITPPTPCEIPQNLTVDCGSIPPACTMEGCHEHDHYLSGLQDDINVTYSNSVVSTGGSSYSVLKREWLLVDTADNKKTITQYINVTDTEAPVFSRLPGNVSVECDCDTFPVMHEMNATDNCDGEITVVDGEETLFRSPANSNDYVLKRTWTATDTVMNLENKHVQYVTVSDNEAPSFMNSPGTVDVHCDHLPILSVDSGVYVRDSCDANPTLTYTDSTTPTAKNCAQDYVLTRTFTASDVDTNTATFQQTIHVYDNVAPVATSGTEDDCLVYDDTKTGNADYVSLSVIEVEDNCDTAAEATFVSCNSTGTTSGNTCVFMAGGLLVLREQDAVYDAYFKLEDACGNSRMVKQRLFYPMYATSTYCRTDGIGMTLTP
jgi:hypothetical protein